MTETLNKIIRRRDLPLYTGLRKSTINRLIAENEFPSPIKLTSGGRAKGWLEADIVEWQQRRREASREVSMRRDGS